MPTPELIPLTVIGGYLGAGKTTLINQLLHRKTGCRLAVVVNDFGSINIDAALIDRHDGDTMSLTNGCICCSMASGFMSVLSQLQERDDPPQHIVVEASGVADPLKLGQYGHVPGFSPGGIIVLADAETIRRRSQDRYVGRTVMRQLQGADLVVLTKTDLIGDADVGAVEAWVSSEAPNASIVLASHGAIPPELILGTDMPAPGVSADMLARDQDDMESNHDHVYETWTYEQDSPMTIDAVTALAAVLPGGVLRAKGLVHLAEDSEHAAIFQMVGKRWSLTEGSAWGERPPRTAIVVIGIAGSLDWSLVTPQFDGCWSS